MADNQGAQQIICFVISPIGDKYAAHGTGPRQIYEESIAIWENVIKPACRACDLHPVRADPISRAGEIPEQTFQHLRDDTLVIADLTGGNPNVMYELGLRHTTGKLTIQVGERGKLPAEGHAFVGNFLFFATAAHNAREESERFSGSMSGIGEASRDLRRATGRISRLLKRFQDASLPATTWRDRLLAIQHTQAT